MSVRGAVSFYAAAFVVIVCLMIVLAFIMLRGASQARRATARINKLRRDHDQAPLRATARIAPSRLIMLIGNFGRALAGSGLLPAKTLAELQASLDSAGLRGGSGLGLFIGCKVLLLAGLAAAGWLLSRQFVTTAWLATALPLAGGLLGMLAPDFQLRRMRRKHLKQVELGLPDALDMLVICSEAGLSLEAGIERVAHEIRPAHAAIAEEMQTTATALRVSADRRQVLLDMGARTNLDSLRRLAATLIQTAQFGTPLSHALRMLATEMRQEALTRFEANAARLPVLLTVPMIIFILPCIFIIVGGPAAIQLTNVLGNK